MYNEIVCAIERGPQTSNSTPEDFLYEKISLFLENKESKKKKGKKTKKNDSKNANRGTYWIKGFLDGKKGVIRDKMMGKRKNQTLRAVIAPAIGKMPWGYIQLPSAAKKFLYVKEMVTPNTYEYYYDLFGEKFEDCKISHVIYSSGNRRGVSCRVNKNSWERHRRSFGPGDEVERTCQDGDVALFNRQPTLGKDSMMGYTIEYVDGYVIRLHLADTNKHNADFDGDESNSHHPQTVGMKMELATFAHCTNQIISDNNNAPTIGVVFNGISAAYLMSQYKNFKPEIWERCYRHADEPSGTMGSEEFVDYQRRLAKYGVDQYSGSGLLSSLFPANFFYRKGKVEVKEGILISGTLTKSHVGRVSNSFIQSIFRQTNRTRTVEFISRIYFMLEWFIEYRGLTVGYLDCSLTPEKYQEMSKYRQELIRETQHKNNLFIKQVPATTDFTKRYVEKQCLANIQGIGAKIMNSVTNNISTENPMSIMITSEAKGNSVNMSQIVTMLGQQLINGKRPTPKLSQGKRCLPYYKMNSTNLEANGFCKHSFAEGLSPAESFFHFQAARIGLMDTGIKVSETGNYQRRMMKVMEDLSTGPNSQTESATGSEFSAVNFDGFNPTFLSNVGISSDGADHGMLTAPFDPSEIFSRINSEFL